MRPESSEIPPQLEATWGKSVRFDKAAQAQRLQRAKGRTIVDVWWDYEWGLLLTLDDGSVITAEGIWHNDSTDGTAAGHWTPEELS